MMEQERIQITGEVIANRRIQGEYFQLDLQVPELADLAKAGQFVHLLIPDFEHRVLRRPFSIYDTDAASGRLSLVYKVVGEGTKRLSEVRDGMPLNLLGPLGNGFSPMGKGGVIVAGGFGCAATFLLAKHAEYKPLVLIGGRSSGDILLKKEYEALGCEVRISTDDGSMGMKGRVTELLEREYAPGQMASVAACGPIPMLKALASSLERLGLEGELSMDNAMCCGVGACFACVTKVKDSSEQGWRYARVCSEGPVFPARMLLWD